MQKFAVKNCGKILYKRPFFCYNKKKICATGYYAQAVRTASLGLRRCGRGAFFYGGIRHVETETVFRSFTGFEWALWIGSVAVTVAAFLLTGNTQYYYLFGSVLGATALILVSKGNVAGQILVVFFSIFYAAVSYRLRYFGEMITYLGMSLPIAVVAVVTWLKNPFRGNKTEVTVNHISASEYVLLVLGGIAVTVAFYFILRALNTANLILSTVSVFTSFLAAYLTMRRSPFYAIGYAMNDVVLILLWVLAAMQSAEYLSMVICFFVFLANDLYGFVNWLKIRKRQAAAQSPVSADSAEPTEPI